MSDRDRERWEAKHSQHAETALPLASLAWLPSAPPQGLALDLACGSGRHCEQLLRRGYRVVAADISLTALRRVLAGHRPRADRIMAVATDFDQWTFRAEVFDLIVQCDFLDRRLFAAIRSSVRTGGYLLIDTFCGPGTGSDGPRCRDYRLEDGELLGVFADWEILRHESAARGRDAILARKPQALTHGPCSDTRSP